MKEINENSEKLNSRSCSKSIRDDFKDDNLIFSEESTRVIDELGNMELFLAEANYRYYSVSLLLEPRTNWLNKSANAAFVSGLMKKRLAESKQEFQL